MNKKFRHVVFFGFMIFTYSTSAHGFPMVRDSQIIGINNIFVPLRGDLPSIGGNIVDYTWVSAGDTDVNHGLQVFTTSGTKGNYEVQIVEKGNILAPLRDDLPSIGGNIVDYTWVSAGDTDVNHGLQVFTVTDTEGNYDVKYPLLRKPVDMG